jgi:hypothetical protein
MVFAQAYLTRLCLPGGDALADATVYACGQSGVRPMSAAVPGAVTAAPVAATHPQQPPQRRNLMALPSGAAS